MNETPSNGILKMNHIYKEFYGNYVLQDVNISVNSGEVFAIIGQNGAGKSTLMKILSGIHPKGTYTGEIILGGKPVEFSNVREAERTGVLMIPQEIEVFPNLSVAENLYYNTLQQQRFIDWNALYAKAKEDLKEYSVFDIDVRQKMENLTRGEQQMLLIVKALIQTQSSDGGKVLILDEPTASLTESETKVLFDYIDQIKKRGIACIYISHRLAEVFKIADRIMVMRNGEVIETYVTAESDQEEVITCMTGEKLKKLSTEVVEFGEEILSAQNLVVYDRVIHDRKLVNGLDLHLHRGEVLGVYGLLGSGKTETAMSIYGAWEGKSEGTIVLDGEEIHPKSTLDAIKKGINFLPEDRRQALFDVRSIRENMSMLVLKRFCNRLGLMSLQEELKAVHDSKDDLKLKAHSLEDSPNSLSGGNKQKALVGRILLPDSKVLIFDEPSVGVDIGTRMDLYDILRETAKETQCGILVFSSDVDEILQVSDQIMVLKNGKQSAFFTQEQVKSGSVDQDMIIMAAISS